MRTDLPADSGQTVPAVRTPIVMNGSPLVYERASPRLGEHTDVLLASLGYSAADLARFRQAAVIGYMPLNKPPST